MQTHAELEIKSKSDQITKSLLSQKANGEKDEYESEQNVFNKNCPIELIGYFESLNEESQEVQIFKKMDFSYL